MNYSRRQLYAMGEPLGDSVTYRKVDGGLLLGGGGGGGGDVFQDIGNAVSDVGKSVSNAVEDTSKNLTTVLQPIEKATSQAVSDFSKDPSKATTNLLQPVEKTINYVAAHPEAQLSIALAIAAPYAAAQIAPFLTPYLGSYATMASQAIANVTVAVAQGVPIEKATEDALINAATSGATKEVQNQLNTVISSPGIKNAITSTVSSGLNTAAKGGSQADIEKAMTAGLVGSSASDLYGAAFGVDPNQSTGAKVAQIAAKESALGRTSQQITASILTQFGQKALDDYLKTPSVAPALDQTAAEDARLAGKEATLAGAEKGAYMPDGSFTPPTEEPKQGAYLPSDAQPNPTTSEITTPPYKPNIVTAISKSKPTPIIKSPTATTTPTGSTVPAANTAVAQANLFNPLGLTAPQTQQMTNAFPQLANVFYYGKDTGSKKQVLDENNQLVFEDAEQGLASGGRIADNKDDAIDAYIRHIVEQSGGPMSQRELLAIVKGL
jgi:fructose-specific component phosphotransferase system IIB-like protein